VPGWGATAGLYASGLPEGWEALELPTFRRTGGDLAAYRCWLGSELARRGGTDALAGHSMGGALALLAAADQPELVEKLILVSPAGLPLDKPLRASAITFLGQVTRRSYPLGELRRAVGRMLAAPRAALRLARTVHDLDLEAEVDRIRSHRIPCIVVGCATDMLVTCAHCRRLAVALDAAYREVDARGGHIWMITQPELLGAELAC
jgi:pimeloyl-ACP methyl ester carboxylesterase